MVKSILFANDATILNKSLNLPNLTNNNLTILSTKRWIAANGLSTNEAKTHKMIFDNPKSTRFLDIHIDSQLSVGCPQMKLQRSTRKQNSVLHSFIKKMHINE